MKIAVTGATGFIGTALVEALTGRGDRVAALTRNTVRFVAPSELVEPVAWPSSGGELPVVDAVVNLAGESISGRWDAAKKRAIRASRVEGARRLVDALSKMPARPGVLVSASAVGYYGDRGEQELTENSEPGTGFLPEVCVEWEREVSKAVELGMRVVLLRTAVVLDSGGGALTQMLTPFRAGVGGPMGSGRQWFPWIHRTDLLALYLSALDGSFDGPVNAASPGVVRQADFARTLGAVVGRPAVLPAPAFALRLLLGEFADTLLHSQRVVPAKAQTAGFKFRYPSLVEALVASVGKASA